MTKKICFLKAALLVLTLLPAQQTFTSEPTKPTNNDKKAAAFTTTIVNVGWLSKFNPWSSNPTETAPKKFTIEQLAAAGTLAKHMQAGTLAEVCSDNVADVEVGITISRLIDAKSQANLQRTHRQLDARSRLMQSEQQDAILAELTEAAQLSTKGVPAIISPAVQRSLDERKARDAHVKSVLTAGLEAANKSRREREELNLALSKSEQTQARLRAPSPAEDEKAYLARLFREIEATKKAEATAATKK